MCSSDLSRIHIRTNTRQISYVRLHSSFGVSKPGDNAGVIGLYVLPVTALQFYVFLLRVEIEIERSSRDRNNIRDNGFISITNDNHGKTTSGKIPDTDGHQIKHGHSGTGSDSRKPFAICRDPSLMIM